MFSKAIVLALFSLAISANAFPHFGNSFNSNGNKNNNEECNVNTVAPVTVTATHTVTVSAAAATTAASSSSSNNESSGGSVENHSSGSSSSSSSKSSGSSGSSHESGSSQSSHSSGSSGDSSESSSSSKSGSSSSSSKSGSSGSSSGNSGSSGSTTTTSATAASTSSSSSNNASSGGAAVSSGNSTSSTGGDQSSLTLDQSVIATGFEDDGQDVPEAGQVASLTSSNNFINFCATVPNLPITNGKQITTGSCNPAPMGIIPSTANMPSAKFTFPANFGTVPANTEFTISMAIQGMETGFFVNAASNYFAAPQQVNSAGQVTGHSHVVVELLTSLTSTTPQDPTKFAFFKGLNAPAANGLLTADVASGLPAGAYRLCSINTAANHQPILVPIAQHGSLDDCIYFTASGDGANSTASAAPAASASAAATSAAAASATSAASTAAKGSANKGSVKSTGKKGGRRFVFARE